MTEEQKVARARELQDDGLSLRAIGRELGISHSSVTVLLDRSGPTCRGCGATMREPNPEEKCGFCKLEAIEDLGEPSPTCTFAIFELRDLGHGAEEVVAALRRRQGGAPVEDVAAELGVPA